MQGVRNWFCCDLEFKEGMTVIYSLNLEVIRIFQIYTLVGKSKKKTGTVENLHVLARLL